VDQVVTVKPWVRAFSCSGFSGPMFLVMAPVLVFRCSASRRDAHIMMLAATSA
jgi:hypothetical protein